jgi:hypothetical protein
MRLLFNLNFFTKKGVLNLEGRQIYGNIEMKNFNIFLKQTLNLLLLTLKKSM